MERLVDGECGERRRIRRAVGEKPRQEAASVSAPLTPDRLQCHVPGRHLLQTGDGACGSGAAASLAGFLGYPVGWIAGLQARRKCEPASVHIPKQ